MKRLLTLIGCLTVSITSADIDISQELERIETQRLKEQTAEIIATAIADAEQDFSNNVYQIKIWGLGRAIDGRSIEEQYLMTQYGITYQRVAGCIVSKDQMTAWKTYNDKMKALLEEKYEVNRFDDLIRKAMVWQSTVDEQSTPVRQPVDQKE